MAGKRRKMIDREKVIKGLERCTSGDNSCEGCPYFNGIDLTEGGECVNATQKDALALLKADHAQAESVPLKPLAKWLAWYAMPPGGLRVHKVVGRSGEDYARLRAESWEYFLRGMDWEADE